MHGIDSTRKEVAELLVGDTVPHIRVDDSYCTMKTFQNPTIFVQKSFTILHHWDSATLCLRGGSIRLPVT